jgi:hypothetical protein
MGEGAPPLPISAWLAGFSQMAAACAAGAADLAARSAIDEAADILWTTLEAQLGLWRATLTGGVGPARSSAGRETLQRFTDPAQWAFGGDAAPDAALQALIATPGPAAGFGTEALRSSPEWAALRAARGRHRALVAMSWQRCFARMAADAPGDDGIEAWLDRWETVAGEALDALHADPAFLHSLRDLVMAAVALREAAARQVEAFCTAHGLPTRREVDDLHRTVTALRRDLRALRRDRDGG